MRKKIIIRGVVQGVGFRPFVYQLAQKYELTGWVNNSAAGVIIEAEGKRENLSKLEADLKNKKPAIAQIMSYESNELDDAGYRDFKIISSTKDEKASVLILPDTATCNECRAEILDSQDRRYYYPFTNCTNCGPRYSIIKSLPYDRVATTMKDFTLCEKCRSEYEDPSNRRFHAQPNACGDCGPTLEFTDASGCSIIEHEKKSSELSIKEASRILHEGFILALKGLGGFQLLVDASNEKAVRRLRERKFRQRKPFAVMMCSIEEAEKYTQLSLEQKNLLQSNAAPIVLAKKKDDPEIELAESVSFANPYLGIMLPYTPLHILLMKEFGKGVVATSGNLSSEPICIDNREALESLGSIADYFLMHNRPIERAVDDSLLRMMGDRPMMIRRARGFAPLPLILPEIEYNILATGAHLKNTIALSRKEHVFVSQHIGDLENEKTYSAFVQTINDLIRLLEIEPQLIVADMHPNYLSRQFAEKYSKTHGIVLIEVQHHYAHLLSVLAENEVQINENEKVLGVVWDGTGYGVDGSIWGSEFMVADYRNYERIGSLQSIALPGGEKAIREPWRILFSIFYDMSENFSQWEKRVDEWQSLYGVEKLNKKERRLFYSILEKGINCPRSSGMGRLFDAVSALLGFTSSVSFEGEAAMELEFLASAAVGSETQYIYDNNIYKDENPFAIHNGMIDTRALIEQITKQIHSTDPSSIALKFHSQLAHLILEFAKKIKLPKVALSGGVFQNALLSSFVIDLLKRNSFQTYWHQKVPANDGGVSLGQIVYSNAYLRENR